MLNAFYILSTHPKIPACKLSSCEILSDIYQILTKTDYLQGSNFHGNLISRMAKLFFLFAQVLFQGY